MPEIRSQRTDAANLQAIRRHIGTAKSSYPGQDIFVMAVDQDDQGHPFAVFKTVHPADKDPTGGLGNQSRLICVTPANGEKVEIFDVDTYRLRELSQDKDQVFPLRDRPHIDVAGLLINDIEGHCLKHTEPELSEAEHQIISALKLLSEAQQRRSIERIAKAAGVKLGASFGRAAKCLKLLTREELRAEPSMKWLDRHGRKGYADLTPPAFIKKVYGSRLGRGFTQADLKKCDESLYMALHKWLQQPSEADPSIRNRIPSDVFIPTLKEWNDWLFDQASKNPGSIPSTHIGKVMAASYRRAGQGL